MARAGEEYEFVFLFEYLVRDCRVCENKECKAAPIITLQNMYTDLKAAASVKFIGSYSFHVSTPRLPAILILANPAFRSR